MAFNPASVPVVPIASVSPFGGKPWLKARVTDKSEIKTWNKPSSSGKLFGCTLVDESSAIRATFFNEACDQFYSMLHNGQIFFFGGGSVKNANRRFNNVNNEYEISFDKDASIHACRDAGTAIPSARYNFVPVSVLQHKERYSPVDLLVVITKVSEVTKLVSKKTGKEMVKRVVTVADTTAAVDITLWEEQALDFTHAVGQVVAIRNGQVNTWDGVSVSTGKDTVWDAAPALNEAKTLDAWYRNTGAAAAGTLSVRQGTMGAGESGNKRGRATLVAIETNNLGKGEKADFLDVKVVPVHVKTDQVWYDACDNCKKKLVKISDDEAMMRCEKCDKSVYPKARYLASVQVTDGVASRWITLFDEAGEQFFGMPADTLKHLARQHGNAIAAVAQAKVHQPFLMTLRCKEDLNAPTTVEDKVKLTATRVTPVNADAATIVRECDAVLAQIALYH